MKTTEQFIKTGQIYLWEDILQSGLDTERFVKISKYHSLNLSNQIECHELTHFQEFTFVHFPNTNKFKVEENNYTWERAERLTQIRNIEWEITSLEIYIWHCKLEGNTIRLPYLQSHLFELKSQLLYCLNYRTLNRCA